MWWLCFIEQPKRTLINRCLFFCLCCFEVIYCFCFSIVQRWRGFFYHAKDPSVPVISVGNLTVGGTGKTLFCQFLLNQLQQLHYRPALLMRGYKSLWIKNNKQRSLIVSFGDDVLFDAILCGDEAYEVATKIKVPVVIGKNRLHSYRLLQQELVKQEREPLSCIVLDDGYQQVSIRKNLEILLFDIRRPFDNGHCLPAGRLREKDVSRAHVIVLTHADRVVSQTRYGVCMSFSQRLPNIPILTGSHVIEGLFLQNGEKNFYEKLRGGRCLLVAGIGAFDQFVDSIASLGLLVERAMQFPDHHAYTIQDLAAIKQAWDFFEDCICIITTAKDWGKIQMLLRHLDEKFSQHWYVARVRFEFMSKTEEETFRNMLQKLQI